ncbi:cation:proton antiporter [Defluviitalea phaphyphila]|uniref:cation:proton antiporter n=1 Tax=Defluviitalea phaphyphila TaxID=1473580 RepID=UPI000730AC6E|nr:cation:proton antiporter [Defluviitalea phaphyphila]
MDKQYLLELSILLISALVGGWIVSLIKMPKVLGQILAGIILGPTVLGLINGEDELIHTMSEIGVIFLMFLAGLEADINELKTSGKRASIIAIGGVILPLILGTVVPYFMFPQYLPSGSTNQKLLFALYIGTILTATSVSISVSVLRDMNQISSKQGVSILGAAIIDDVLGIILLATITGIINPSSNSNIIMLIIKIIVFFISSIVFGFIISKLVTKFAHGRAWSERIVTFAIILCFLLSFISERFEIAAITGAYISGVIFSTTPYGHKVANKIQVLAYTLFTPIFFISIGLKVKLTSDILAYWKYALVISIIAILGKIIGCGLGALMSKFNLKQSIQIGAGMIAREEVALIVASQGMIKNFITKETFTSVVLLVVISSIVTPPLLKFLFSKEEVTSNF